MSSVWILCGKISYEVERVSEELEKLGVLHSIFSWNEITLPFKGENLPRVVWHRYDPTVSMVFQFCVLEEFERQGVYVINRKEAVENSDKASIYLLWSKYLRNHVKMPDTLVTRDIDAAVSFLKSHRRVVFKPLASGRGLGVQLIEWNEFAPKLLEELLRKYGCIFLQKYIHNPNYDVRSIVIGGRVVASFARYNERDFRHNIHCGGQGLKIEEMGRVSKVAFECVRVAEQIAPMITEITGLDMYGLDLLPGIDNSVYLLEWNAFFGFEGLEKTTGLNVAREVARYIALKLGERR
ncbi:MAG: ATP-grasp domain-containing protein [Candidatus Baldrarchaeia archaeon]